jgi:hypothetical protein
MCTSEKCVSYPTYRGLLCASRHRQGAKNVREDDCHALHLHQMWNMSSKSEGKVHMDCGLTCHRCRRPTPCHFLRLVHQIFAVALDVMVPLDDVQHSLHWDGSGLEANVTDPNDADAMQTG